MGAMRQTDETRPANRKRESFIKARMPRWFGRLHSLDFFRAFVLALLGLALSTNAWADTISGTVKDPSGAIVVEARVEIVSGRDRRKSSRHG